jgi:hypothetical protein
LVDPSAAIALDRRAVRGGGALSSLWALALAGSAAALPSSCSQSGTTVTCMFSAQGSEGTFAVPAGVTSVHVVASGGAGGRSLGGWGGRGAQVSSDLSVTPTSTVFVEVGIGGGAGGVSSGGGGGESDVRTCSIADSSCPAVGSAQNPRLVVAGGGGGAGGAGGGGNGGAGTCSVGSLGPANIATITIVVRTTKPGTLTDTATASASNVSMDPDDSATATTTVTGT